MQDLALKLEILATSDVRDVYKAAIESGIFSRYLNARGYGTTRWWTFLALLVVLPWYDEITPGAAPPAWRRVADWL